MAESNYGATFTKGSQPIGDCIVLDFPEIKMDAVESTNHASGGNREFIPSMLYGLGEITLSVIVASGVIDGMFTELAGGTISSCVITNSVDSMTFDGFYTSIKPEAADAQKPDVDKVTVVLQPTGDIQFS